MTDTSIATNSRKALRRARGPHINSRVIAAADAGDLDALASTIADLLPCMNLVNLTTSLHRFAKLHMLRMASGLGHHVQTLHLLLAAVHEALPRVESMCLASQGQILSNVMWSLKVLRCPECSLMRRVTELSAPRLGTSQSSELASLLTSFMELGQQSSEAMECATTLCHLAAGPVQARLTEFNLKGLVMVATAYATCGVRDAALFRAIAGVIAKSLAAARGHELVQVARAFGMAGILDVPLLEEVACRAAKSVGALKAQCLVEIAWTVAAAGVCDEAFAVAGAGRAKALALQPHELASLTWSLTCKCPRSPTAECVVLSLLPQCTRQVANFLPQDLVSVVLVVARCFGATSAAAGPRAAARQRAREVPRKVLNFVEVAVPVLLGALEYLAGPPFANFVSALLAIGAVEGQPHVGAQVARHICAHASTFASSVLFSLLRDLEGAADAELAAAGSQLFAALAARVSELGAAELDAVSQLCCSRLGLASQNLPMDELAQKLRWLSNDVEGCGLASPAGPSATLVRAAFAVSPSAGAKTPATADRLTISTDFDSDVEAAPTTGGTCGGAAAAMRPGSAVSAFSSEGGSVHSASGWLLHGCGAAAAGDDAADGRSSRSTEEGDVEGSPMARARSGFRMVVRNSFVEVVEEDDAPMPPALSIIPHTVSRDVLDKFRTDYRKLRSGRSTPPL